MGTDVSVKPDTRRWMPPVFKHYYLPARIHGVMYINIVNFVTPLLWNLTYLRRVRPVVTYASETWVLKEAIFKN
jgi:hypothetical protein